MSPEPVSVILYDKEDFVIQLKTLKWGDYPGLYGWTQYNHSGSYSRDLGRIRQRNVMMEADFGVMHFEDEKGLQAKGTGSH